MASPPRDRLRVDPYGRTRSRNERGRGMVSRPEKPMKRIFHFYGRVNAEGRCVEVSRFKDALIASAEGCDDVVPVVVMLPQERRGGRLGRAAQERRDAGGPRVAGRMSASVDEWAKIRAAVLTRDRGCRACYAVGPAIIITDPDRLEPENYDVHHVEKASQGGSDFDLDLLITLCRFHHAMTDAPFVEGKLVILPLGNGTFDLRVVTKANKWAHLPEAAE